MKIILIGKNMEISDEFYNDYGEFKEKVNDDLLILILNKNNINYVIENKDGWGKVYVFEVNGKKVLSNTICNNYILCYEYGKEYSLNVYCLIG